MRPTKTNWNYTASHSFNKNKAKSFPIRQQHYRMTLQKVFLDLVVLYRADQIDRQTVSLLTKYPLYCRTVLAITVDKRFGARNLAHGSAKGVGYFGDPLCFLRQSPHVSKPQPPVGFCRHTFWNRNPAGNPPDQNSLWMSFENILLQVLGYTDEGRNLISGPAKDKLV